MAKIAHFHFIQRPRGNLLSLHFFRYTNYEKMVIRMLVAELAFLKKLLLRNNADVINAASFRFAWIDLLNKNENELFFIFSEFLYCSKQSE